MQQSETSHCAQTDLRNSLCDSRHAGLLLARPAMVGRPTRHHSEPRGQAWTWPRSRARVGLGQGQEGRLARSWLPARPLEAGPLLSSASCIATDGKGRLIQAAFFFCSEWPVQPPCACTTLRQPSDSFSLLARRHAFICGGLPTCSAQNFPASPRQAICSCGVGPDCADAGRKAVAVRMTKESVADVRCAEIFMIASDDE